MNAKQLNLIRSCTMEPNTKMSLDIVSTRFLFANGRGKKLRADALCKTNIKKPESQFGVKCNAKNTRRNVVSGSGGKTERQ